MKDNGATLAFEPTHVQIVRISLCAIRDRLCKDVGRFLLHLR